MEHREESIPAFEVTGLQIRTSNAQVLAFYRSLGYLADDVVCLGKRLVPDLPPSA